MRGVYSKISLKFLIVDSVSFVDVGNRLPLIIDSSSAKGASFLLLFQYVLVQFV